MPSRLWTAALARGGCCGTWDDHLRWEQAAARMESAASFYSDGEVLGFETHATHQSTDLACLVEGESYRVKVRGSDDPAEISLRVTSIFRREQGQWRLVHRHADTITTARPDESYLDAG